MALRAAYENLQLDPDDGPRVATFMAFCWQQILQHTTQHWIAEVRNCNIRLQYRQWAPSHRQSCSVYHETLDTVVSAFVLDYAELLWPIDIGSRKHLASARNLRDSKDIYATPANVTISRKKEAEMRECNVVPNSKTSTVESMIGCRVRSYLTQLLVSEHPIPADEPMSASKILRRFLYVTPLASTSGKKRSYDSTTNYVNDEGHFSDESRPDSPPTQKRRKVYDAAESPMHVPRGHSTGPARPRFTHIGTRRLFCPPLPTAGLHTAQKRTGDAGELTNSVNDHASNDNQECNAIRGDYQCWLRHCSEIFQTTGDVVDHVQQQHPASMEAAFPSVGRAITAFHSKVSNVSSPGVQQG